MIPSPSAHDRAGSALVIIDLQPGFLPGDALAVHGGDEILAPIRALMESDAFACCATTQDWRPSMNSGWAETATTWQPRFAIKRKPRQSDVPN